VDAFKAIQAYKAAATMQPVMAWLAALAAGALLHWVIPSLLIALVILLGGSAMAGLAMWHTRTRKDPLHKWLPAGTCLAVAWWVAWADVRGLHARWTLAAWLVAGGFVAFAWIMRAHMGKATADGGGVSEWFASASGHTTTPGLRLTDVKAEGGRITAVAEHPPGVSTEDVTANLGALESAGNVPAGSLNISPHPHSARRSLVTVVNPRTLSEPRLYPGPSHPGGSMADPLRWGRFADGSDWLATPFAPGGAGWQLMVTGMTGTAKTTGVGYTALGEMVTRQDAAVIVVDPAKGEQFMGPMRPALHHLETDLDGGGVERTLLRINGMCRPRMDYLGRLGLPRWREGCGLSAVGVWVEEAAWVFNALGAAAVKQWVLPMVLTARSAGVFIVLSLQRASWDQIPPVIRAQLASVCMGVEQKKDADFGLSHEQKSAGCDPSKWGPRHPGMCYTDMPGVDARHAVMDARADWWGDTADLIAAHCQEWPASARPVDEMTAELLFGDPPADPPEPDPDGLAPDPEPEYPGLHLVGSRQADGPGDAHAALRQRVLNLIAARHQIIRMSDLDDLTTEGSPTYIGRTRRWLYGAMRGPDITPLVEERSEPRRWLVREPEQGEAEGGDGG